jgi:hypothetical protein
MCDMHVTYASSHILPKTGVFHAGAAPTTMLQVSSRLATLFTDPRHSKDLKTRLPLVRACGHLAARTPQHPLRAALVDLLLSQTPPSTIEDVHAAVGESISLSFSGADSSVAAGFLFTQQAKLSEVLKYVEAAASGAAPSPNPKDDTTLYSLGQQARSNGQVVHEADEELKSKVLECSLKRAGSGTVAESAAAAVWLVCLLMFCGGDAAVRGRLDALQAVFVQLMGCCGACKPRSSLQVSSPDYTSWKVFRWSKLSAGVARRICMGCAEAAPHPPLLVHAMHACSPAHVSPKLSLF